MVVFSLVLYYYNRYWSSLFITHYCTIFDIRIALRIFPLYNWHKISNKTGNNTFHESIISYDDVFFMWTCLVNLASHWNFSNKSKLSEKENKLLPRNFLIAHKILFYSTKSTLSIHILHPKYCCFFKRYCSVESKNMHQLDNYSSLPVFSDGRYELPSLSTHPAIVTKSAT